MALKEFKRENYYLGESRQYDVLHSPASAKELSLTKLLLCSLACLTILLVVFLKCNKAQIENLLDLQ